MTILVYHTWCDHVITTTTEEYMYTSVIRVNNNAELYIPLTLRSTGGMGTARLREGVQYDEGVAHRIVELISLDGVCTKY